MSFVTDPAQPGELRPKAEAFRSLFEGSLIGGPPADLFDQWEVCGAVRRGKPAVDVAHVVRPSLYTAGRDTPPLNPVWTRMLELFERGDVTPGRYWVEPESRVVECVHLGRLHRVFLATRDNWGLQLVRHTGPEGYFEMTVARLKAAGTLTLHNGHVCHVDRSQPQPKLTSIECPTEDDYLRLARTKYSPPGRRFAPPPHTWHLGMLKPHHPEFLLPYADVVSQPWLIPVGDNRPARRRGHQRSPNESPAPGDRPAPSSTRAASPGPQRPHLPSGEGAAGPGAAAAAP